MGFILRKILILVALSVAVSGAAIAKTNDSSTKASKAKSGLIKKKKAKTTKSKTVKAKTTKAKKAVTKTRKTTSTRATAEGKEQYKNITVNINKADASALSAYLPGIGVVKATEIVKYRRANGKFKSLKDLMNVDGVGEATLDGMKKNISLSRGKSIAPEGYVMGELPKSNKKSKPRKTSSKVSRSTGSKKSSSDGSRSTTSSASTKAKKLKNKKVLKKKTMTNKKKKLKKKIKAKSGS